MLKKFSANGAVIVSDGEDDEMVIPVIQNIIPIVSVQRVVMQVSRTIEHSYAVFGKFLKLVMYNPKYSKFFLGVPGILLYYRLCRWVESWKKMLRPLQQTNY